ncbi:MAG: cytochrome c [Gammaproteobacteria bacterium]|nr:cytochrome c [Gammaproteobacteria bacterium]
MMRAPLMIAGAVLAMAGPLRAADPADRVAAGKALFDRHCAYCHAAGPGHAGTMRLAEARGADRAVLEARTDLDPAYIRLVVRQGLVEMPPVRKIELDDAAVQQIVAYLTRPR